MSPDDTTPKTDRLGELLRQADPAAQTPGLPAEDAHEIRRNMLHVAEEARRPFLQALAGRVPRPAWAAVAVLLLLAVVWTWRTGDDPSPTSPETPIRITETPREAPPSETPPAVPEPPAPKLESPTPEARVTHRDPADEPAADAASRPHTPRQVHMQAPGGTRIVWVLDPDLTL